MTLKASEGTYSKAKRQDLKKKVNKAYRSSFRMTVQACFSACSSIKEEAKSA